MHTRLILTLLVAFCSSLFGGDIGTYFKPCLNKEGNHQMRNIDFIYTINLDQRPEKFATCTAQLEPFGIFPYRFSAVNGWELSLDLINDVGVKYDTWMQSGIMGTYYPFNDGGKPCHETIAYVGRNYFCHCMGRGPIGIVLSHLSILQDAYDAGYETIWVMEDDIQIIQDPHLISDRIDQLDALVGKEGWDLFFTDQDTKNQKGEYVSCTSYALRPNFSPANPGRFATRYDISPDFRKIGARYGAYSMIVRRSGMKKILDFIKTHQIFLPYDMEFYLPEDVRLYSVTSDIVSTQPNALSDNGAANYLQSK